MRTQKRFVGECVTLNYICLLTPRLAAIVPEPNAPTSFRNPQHILQKVWEVYEILCKNQGVIDLHTSLKNAGGPLRDTGCSSLYWPKRSLFRLSTILGSSVLNPAVDTKSHALPVSRLQRYSYLRRTWLTLYLYSPSRVIAQQQQWQ